MVGRDFEWLKLTYSKPINVVKVQIHETNNPGAVVKISAFIDGVEKMIWEGDDPTGPEEASGISEIEIAQPTETKQIKVYLDTAKVAGSNEIDAVAVVDDEGKVCYARAVEASSSVAEIMEPMVITSSKADESKEKEPWSAEQATGVPDTATPGHHATAWASLEPDEGEEWIMLEYEKSIIPDKIRIYETHNPGAVHRITLLQKDKEIEIWRGKDPTPIGLLAGVSEIDLNTNYETQTVKIYLDSQRVLGWNEIDAVALVDKDGNTYWPNRANASSVFQLDTQERGESIENEAN
jgi:hypothetical protein